ncbi:MAG: sterol desaturase family protein [Bradymonadia bacterium]
MDPAVTDLSVMTKLGVWLAVALPVAVGMELWAMFLHGKIWHTWLYGIHKSHHEPKTGYFELNDVFSVIHAPIAMAMILYGCLATPGLTRELLFGFGLGMTIFGIGYMVVHDGLVHGRLPVTWLTRWAYFRKVRNAHIVHHKNGGAPFGMFLGPQELKWAKRRSGRSRLRRDL